GPRSHDIDAGASVVRRYSAAQEYGSRDREWPGLLSGPPRPDHLVLASSPRRLLWILMSLNRFGILCRGVLPPRPTSPRSVTNPAGCLRQSACSGRNLGSLTTVPCISSRRSWSKLPKLLVAGEPGANGSYPGLKTMTMGRSTYVNGFKSTRRRQSIEKEP